MADDSDTQLPEPQSTECSDITGDHTDPLKYPQILLETPFGSLLNHSYISNSSSRTIMTNPPTRHPPASLSESWASISDAELSQDDDLRSEQTDVGSLVDIRSADDILSLQEEEDGAATSDEDRDVEAQQTYDPLEAQYSSQMKSSEQTPAAGTSLTETSLLPTHLTLDEPEGSPQENDDVLVRHILKVFEETQAASLGFDNNLRLQDPVGTINLKLSKSSLKDTGHQSLHLLILGKDYLPSLRSSIMGKIADALVASGSAFDASPPSSPSRYHIVPDCFGPGSMPSAAEVIPIDCQLEVDSFSLAEFLDQTHQNIRLYNETPTKVLQSGRHEDGYAIRGNEGGKPDLAVVVVSSDDTSADIDKVCVMLIFAQRHSIPVLVITVDDDWSADFCPLVLAGSSAYRCLEARLTGKDDARRQLPLDLDTFLSLNPAQLSRHLAYLIEAPASQDESAQSPQASQQTSIDTSENSWKKQLHLADTLPDVQQMKRVWSKLPPWFLVIFCVILLTQAIISFDVYRTASIKSLPDPAAVTTSDIPFFCSTEVETSRTTAAAVQTVEAAPCPPLTIDATKSIAGSFEVEVVGNSHLVVRTPFRPKRKGTLNVTVLRDAKPVAVETKVLFPHVYSVHIAKDEMYGNLTVRLEITNPHLVDTVTLDLGQQPLNVWFKGAIDEAERDLLQKFAQIQLFLEGLRDAESQQKLIQHARRLRSALFEKAKEGQKRLEIYRAKVALLEARIQAWNKRVDDGGAEILEHLKVSGNKMLDDVTKRTRQASRSLRQIGLPKLRSEMAALYGAVGKLRVGQRAQQAIHDLHDKTHSETLATAQDRARHIMKGWRQSRTQDRRG